MGEKSVVAVFEVNPYTDGLRDRYSYMNQVKNSYFRIKDLLIKATKKVDGLKIDLVVLPERTGGMSQNMLQYQSPNVSLEPPYSEAVQLATTKRKIYNDIREVYKWQLNFVSKEICQDFGCAAVVSLLDHDDAKYHVSEEFQIFSQAVFLDETGKITQKYNKINPYLSFVSPGWRDQLPVAELSGGRKVLMALGADVLEHHIIPRKQIMENVDRSETSPIVALPHDWPDGSGAAKGAANMRTWATPLTWADEVPYSNMVVAASNATGISIMVADDGEVMWYTEENASQLEAGHVEYEGSRMFWRTV